MKNNIINAQYENVKPSGWNTWNSRSLLSHVKMPEGFAVNLGLKSWQDGRVLKEALVGRTDLGAEAVRPGVRSADGSYTELTIAFGSAELLIQSTLLGEEGWCILVTPLKEEAHPSLLLVQGAMLWNREGYVVREGDCLKAVLPGRTIKIAVSTKVEEEYHTGLVGPYLCAKLSQPIVVSTVGTLSVQEAYVKIEQAKQRVYENAAQYGELSEAYLAMSACLCWDTVFEPEKDRICSPVSRIWSIGWGGYVLLLGYFFSAMLAIPISRELSYSNLRAIMAEQTEAGFIPNFGAANDYKTRDRSQPPVGSLALREIYLAFGEKEIVAESFDTLLTWNRWFRRHRMLENGQLCWGSDSYEPLADRGWETEGVGEIFGAALESGMDNSPLYDGVAFDRQTHLMCMADVGLTGLYIMDCEILAGLAAVLGRKEEEKELLSCAEHSKEGLEGLWCEEIGMYLNRYTDRESFSQVMTPTNFYALYSDRITPERLQRILKHLEDPAEFGGEFGLPSVTRKNPVYAEQNYWRGRIWAPHNFLVYFALRKQGCKKQCAELAEKSVRILLGEWKSCGHVHENYGGDSGLGCDVKNSDPFYHWGGLLALIGLYQNGYMGKEGKTV